MKMLNTKNEWMTFIMAFLAIAVSVDSRNCKNKLDCSNSECCVFLKSEHQNYIGKCQQLSVEGNRCSSLRLRYSGGTYVNFCPCKQGLVCKRIGNVGIKRIHSTCVNDKINFLSKSEPSTNEKYKRNVSDQLLKDLRHYDTDVHHDDNSEDNPLQMDEMSEEHTHFFDNVESESSFTVKEPDEDLKILWDYGSPPVDWKNDELMTIEDDIQSPTIDKIFTVATTTDKVSKGNDWEEHLGKLMHGMISSVKKQPTEDSSLHDIYHRSSSLSEKPRPIDASLKLHGEKIVDVSHTDSPSDIGWKGTSAESVATIDYTFLLQFLQQIMNSKSNPFGFGKNDMGKQQFIVSDDVSKNGKEEEIRLRRTQSPLEHEWNKATIESLLNEDHMMTQTEMMSVAVKNPVATKMPVVPKLPDVPKKPVTPKVPVAVKKPITIIPNKNPERHSYWFHNNMESVKGGIAPSLHEFDTGSHDGGSLIQMHVSNGEHGKHIYEESDDPDADYMDKF